VNVDHDSGSETEDNPADGTDDDECGTENDDDEHLDPGDNLSSFVAKSGMQWSHVSPTSSRTKAVNIVTGKQGTTAAAYQITCFTDALKLFITDEMVDEILKFSNAEGKRRVLEKGLTEENWSSITREEIDALIGLLYLMGTMQLNTVSIRKIWSSSPIAQPIFRAAMSRNRFSDILHVLRFDDKSTRMLRRQSDKFAPIRDIWQSFVSRCTEMYSPSEYVTIDEQLLGFRGRCPFRQYLPSKPDKYGVKLWICADANSFYVYNAAPYLGKQDATTKQSMTVGARVVCELLKPLEGTGRNVTCDNFFTNVMLADELLTKKLTLIGTMRKNLRDIPHEFLPSRCKPVGSSLFGFQTDKTLVSYVPAKNRAVVLLSSMHHDNKIDQATTKPEIIIDYNRTKGGVDTVDQLCHRYSVKRATRRWPLCIFFGILDLAAINAMIIYLSANTTYNSKKSYKRRIFLEDLSMQLMEGQLKSRQNNPTGLNKRVTDAMAIVGYPCPTPTIPKEARTLAVTRAQEGKRKRCSFCPAKKDCKTSLRCSKCYRHMCAKHGHKLAVCNDCDK